MNNNNNNDNNNNNNNNNNTNSDNNNNNDTNNNNNETIDSNNMKFNYYVLVSWKTCVIRDFCTEEKKIRCRFKLLGGQKKKS